MREHYNAIGRVCSAAVANNDQIVASYSNLQTENGAIGVRIQSGGEVFTVFGEPNTQYFTARIDRRFSYMDNFDVDELVHISDAEETLQEAKDLLKFDGALQPLVHQEEGGSIEYFDGIRVERPIYVYDDFSFKHYREVQYDIIDRSRDAFDKVSDKYGIEMEAEEASAEEGEF